MSVTEWLLWLASVWAVCFLFLLLDVPVLLDRAANRLRQQHTPHWARHGHVPPPDEPAPPHGRHAKPRHI